MIFRGEYWFLSNMYPCDVVMEIGGQPLRFRNAEATFQAGKCPSVSLIFTGLNGFAAKKRRQAGAAAA